MRRFLVGLAVLAIAIVAVVLVTSRGDEEAEGETERGRPGFSLRGSLKDDDAAIDAAVAEWREEIAEDEDEDDDGKDAGQRLREALEPEPDEDITVVWIGRADERQEIAILEHRGLAVLLRRRSAEDNWFISAQRVQDEQDTRGTLPVAVGDAIVVPDGGQWRFVNASYGSGYADTGDGLFWSTSGIDSDGFLIPTRPGADRIPVYVSGIGARVIRRDGYERFEQSLQDGYARAVWQAARDTTQRLEDEREEQPYPDDAPALSVLWTGRLPGWSRAALVLHGDQYDPLMAASLGYGEVPQADDAEERDEGGASSLGTGRTGDLIRTPDTFAAVAWTVLDDLPYLVLAGAGDVSTLHAFVGKEELRRRGPLAVVDGRRFDPKLRPDTVGFGRSASGNVVAPLQRR